MYNTNANNNDINNYFQSRIIQLLVFYVSISPNSVSYTDTLYTNINVMMIDKSHNVQS